ncbi:hypothetical protein [Motilimonas cestriensis]|uniref:hypothetical protein n=1 Tax=Motilimonas cestriensis TaxID=2742685 RepID=UPI003DA40DA6
MKITTTRSKPLLLSLTLLVMSTQAQALGSINGKITAVRVDGSGKGMVYFDKPITGQPPSCVHDAYKNALGFNANTEGGKAVLSFALAAKATNVDVEAYGTGQCGIYGGLIVEIWCT